MHIHVAKKIRDAILKNTLKCQIISPMGATITETLMAYYGGFLFSFIIYIDIRFVILIIINKNYSGTLQVLGMKSV